MPWKAFWSYSHRDEALRDRLATALAPLGQNKLIGEWHDRKIEPGLDWNRLIEVELDRANLILVLLSPDFLASEYCFGVEMERAFLRVKQGAARLVPILLRPCLWEESRFNALQMIPRDGHPITSAASIDEALRAVSIEIRSIVQEPPPKPPAAPDATRAEPAFDGSLDLVRRQLRSYARLYEKTRQRMRPSNDRTRQMEGIFQEMAALATASYPLLAELRRSPLPGDRLAAISILQTFSDEASLAFLVDLVGSEKPFVGFHAAKALRFAVQALDSSAHPGLAAMLDRAAASLDRAAVGFTSDRQTQLRLAREELDLQRAAAAEPAQGYD